MQTKAIFISLLTLGLTILFILPVAAGGWATITLDEIPENVHAGERITIGFTVRQHGINPVADLSPKIVAMHTETKETISVDAISQGEVGHYSVKLNFPQAGTWNWIIQAFTMEQSMPPLVVLPALADGSTSRLSLSLQIWIAGLSIATALAAFVLLISKRGRWATLLLVAALLIIGVGFSQTTIQPSKPVAETAPQPDPIEQGEALFLAKGCITCHIHTSLSSKYKVVSGISGPAGSAPDLTNYAADPTFLRSWLSDPAAVRPDTSMPNLDLSSEEIEALITFLVREPSPSKNTAGGTSKQDCPVTQPPKKTFAPPAPYPERTPADDIFWYGTDELWTSLPTDGTWWGLPYHTHEDGSGHYVQKVVWWNKGYDWQSEPDPEFFLEARRLDGPAPTYESSEATNMYHPDYGSAILTGVEVPTLGCWEFTGSYLGHEMSFVVWVEE